MNLVQAIAATSLLSLLALPAWAQPPRAASPFGPHVFLFDPTMKSETIQSQIDRVYAEQEHSEFGAGRYAFLFQPGEYHVDIPVGFYTEVVGLGSSPDQVRILGNVHADAALRNNNATTTFWRAAENFSVVPTGGTLQWAVSQAVSFRRMHVLGDMVLHQHRGWASGGWMSDTKVDGQVDSGSQQQWISRNTEWKSWTGSSWNMVFVGAHNTPAGDWPQPTYTKTDKTPVLREKPFLIADQPRRYSVRVPSLSHDTVGVSWSAGPTSGRSIPLDRFYIASPTDTAAIINRALANGKNLLLTPGTYDLTEPLRITRKDTVVLGLGFPTLHPMRGTEAMTIADVDGVTVSGLLFDAGELRSPSLLEVGLAGSRMSHAADPISLHDIFFRVGGAAVGKVIANLVIHSNDTVVDHTWIWRADHGKGVGWTSNVSANGLLVDADRVTIYGLFVEHHQEFQVLWKGNAGRTFFYQSELPYDPPDQASWMSSPGMHGWASYKVDDAVKDHQAWGLGIYSVFTFPEIDLANAIEAPHADAVRFHHMTTVALGNHGAIQNVIDGVGGPTQMKPRSNPKVAEFP